MTRLEIRERYKHETGLDIQSFLTPEQTLDYIVWLEGLLEVVTVQFKISKADIFVIAQSLKQ